MRNSPSILRRRAREYRSISLDIGTQEVRDRLLEIADQLERRANAWADMIDGVRESEHA